MSLRGRTSLPECVHLAWFFLGRLRDVCSDRMKLTGSAPVIELVALRLLELVRAGEFDPDRLTEATVFTFKG